MKKISVIIPMYNSEAFIRQCIRSVQEQTYPDWEIIVVDDGSADQGALVCEEMGRNDGRIRLYRQKNAGVSHARNRGLDLAEGEYVFFLDSDDVIHPRLFEEMICRAEKEHAGLVFCGYTLMDEEQPFDAACNTSADWQIAEGREAEEWFHQKYTNKMSGIGGKMIGREVVGKLRFDESLINGEDTYFLYQLVSRGIRSAYSPCGWYYYRMHTESVTHSVKMIQGERYYESSRRIRDGEYRRGNFDYALTWEILAAVQIEKNYTAQRRNRDKEGKRSIREVAAAERKHPMFRRMYLSNRILFHSCFYCYPLYVVLNRLLSVLRDDLHIVSLAGLKDAICRIPEGIGRACRGCRRLERTDRTGMSRRSPEKAAQRSEETGGIRLGRKGEAVMKRKMADVGILTFHCSNNYGAMLQAYGLKRFLQSKRIRVDIVRYEPVYMTGRHWWIPYSPIKGLKGRIWGVMNMWNGFLAHMRMREDFLRQRTNMNRFRFQYLVDKRKHRVLFEKGLERLPYRYYIVGSDQIWNPDITCGFRKAYFGAFDNGRKKKVIAYAASFGGASLDAKYDGEFSKLIGYVDAVSVREEAAIPYVERLSGREVTAVLDPVFFLDKETWRKVEKLPADCAVSRCGSRPVRDGFIFLYITEKNEEMVEYTRRLSKDTGLPVIEVRATMIGADADFKVDHGAGPSEFLGYIDKADYVVSNSFHAVAFSIIYEKQFLAFTHSNLGARVRNILKIHGLESRLYTLSDQDCPPLGGMDHGRSFGHTLSDDVGQDDRGQTGRSRIDSPVDWDEVRKKTREQTRFAGDFLIRNLAE